MEQERVDILIFAMISLLVLSVILIFLFLVFQKKKNFLLRKQILEKQKFDDEINHLQGEIREQTLRNISWELHDNIGQMLTLAKIQLQNEVETPSILEIKNNLGNILNEIRSLSKNINPDFIREINLIQAINLEVGRFNRLNYIKSELIVEGEPVRIPQKVEIVLFRILQEFFSNTVKHSHAKNLIVKVIFNENRLKITAEDNGKGFDMSPTKNNGIGLLNIQKRGSLINAEVKITSQIDKGVHLEITYKIENNEKI